MRNGMSKLSATMLLAVSAPLWAQQHYNVVKSSDDALSKQASMFLEAMKQAAGIKPEVFSPYELLSDQQEVVQKGDKTVEIVSSSFGDDDFFTNMDDMGNTSFDDFKNSAFAQVNGKSAEWNKAFVAQKAVWQKQRKQFLADLPLYKANLVPDDVLNRVIVEPPASDVVPKKPKKTAPGAFHVIKNSLDVPIRNQANRGTCAAFAGVRAVESVLAQHGVFTDLSEQYYYWSAKPDCQQQPCAQGGSNMALGVVLNMEAKQPRIPLEKDCPYNGAFEKGNETQIPLLNACARGVAKPSAAKALKLPQVTAALELNQPVLISTKLSPNFYQSSGFVSYGDLVKSGKVDEHAGGHAMLVVGYIMLPEKQRAVEGNYCLITANSWGVGWGAGGYSCLSKRWLEAKSNYFIGLSSAQML